MSDRETLQEIAAAFGAEADVTVGSWFGKPCLKVGGKVFAVLHGGDLAFKLAGEAHEEALQIDGARLFDPRGKDQPMKQWVQVPEAQSPAWGRLARLAYEYVLGSAPAEKEALISGLLEARREVLNAARQLTAAQQDAVFLGEWSVKDILAHLAGWDDTNVQAVQEILAGQKPSFWQHYDRDWQTYNAQLVATYRRDDFAELLEVVEAAQRRLIAFLQALPADVYIKQPKIGRLLRTDIKDGHEHAQQVEAFRRSGSE